MAVRNASAAWQGTLKQGAGRMKLGSGAFDGPFSFATRFGDEPGANPEELIGAAHAGCFSMYLAMLLEKAGFPPAEVRTTAKVHLGDGPTITLIELNTDAQVPGIDDAAFQKNVQQAKTDCPVSKALAGPEIRVNARLAS